MSALRRERQKSLKQVDFSAIPTALLVKDLYQEQMVRVTMRLTEQSNRMQIVYSLEEAKLFIQDWHQMNA